MVIPLKFKPVERMNIGFTTTEILVALFQRPIVTVKDFLIRPITK